MKIDFDHWKGTYIADEIFHNLDLERRLAIINTLKPLLSKKGDKWQFLYGELPDNCILGVGDTPSNAMDNFITNFYHQKAVAT